MHFVFDWLVADFYVFGLRLQYWMPLFVAIFVILILASFGNHAGDCRRDEIGDGRCRCGERVDDAGGEVAERCEKSCGCRIARRGVETGEVLERR